MAETAHAIEPAKMETPHTQVEASSFDGRFFKFGKNNYKSSTWEWVVIFKGILREK